jgi:hypothetical protein
MLVKKISMNDLKQKFLLFLQPESTENINR